jgi:hypothetical protein
MSNPGERYFLEAKIQQLAAERMNLPRQFENLKKQQEAKIDAFLQEAGVLGKVQELRNEVERYRQLVQTRADNLSGQIEALQEVLNNFHVQTVTSVDQIDSTTGQLLPVEDPSPVVEADEVTQMEDFSQEDMPEKLPVEEKEEEYDEEAEAIENAPDEQALRALLSRYRKS